MLSFKMAVSGTKDVGTRENVHKNSKTDAKTNKKVTLVAQDIKIAKVLAGNNVKLRDRALKRLKKWFLLRTKTMPFTEDDFMRIWKGLFYAMWMSDKPLIQEECAEKIANLVHFPDVAASLMFFKCGLRTLSNEWFGIDQLRLDKFLMFVRRLLRQGLTILKNNSWNVDYLKQYNQVLTDTLLSLDNSPPGGLLMHFMEIYLEEVAKVSQGDLKPHLLIELLKPFVKHLSHQKDNRFISCVKRYIFRHLLRQSDEGIEYEEKFQAWKNEGFPGGSIDLMRKELVERDGEIEEDDDQEMQNDELDPRAGHIDVSLPQLKFNAKQVVELLRQNKFVEGSNTKSRMAITTLLEEFATMAKGHYPLGIRKVDLPKKDVYSVRTKNAVNRLVKFDKKIMNKSTKRKLKNDDNAQSSTKRPRKHEDTQPKEISTKQKSDIDVNTTKNTIPKNKTPKPVVMNKLKNGDVSQLPMKKKRKDEHLLSKKFMEKLGKFIEKSENNIDVTPKSKNTISKNKTPKVVIKKVKRNQLKLKTEVNGFEVDDYASADADFKFSFKRNSGTWFVYDGEETIDSSMSMIEENRDTPEKKTDMNSSMQKSHLSRRPTDLQQESIVRINGDSPKTHQSVLTPKKNLSSKNSLLERLELNKSPKVTSTPKFDKAFVQNEWDVPLQDGELEIFVPANKYKNKMAKHSVSLDEPRFKIKGKNRSSLDSKLVKNPFSMVRTFDGTKKVKIDLKLNKSQEIHEHMAKIKSSPGIPFDANKRPSKPLLKFNVSSPINPFYKKVIDL